MQSENRTEILDIQECGFKKLPATARRWQAIRADDLQMSLDTTRDGSQIFFASIALVRLPPLVAEGCLAEAGSQVLDLPETGAYIAYDVCSESLLLNQIIDARYMDCVAFSSLVDQSFCQARTLRDFLVPVLEEATTDRR